MGWIFTAYIWGNKGRSMTRFCRGAVNYLDGNTWWAVHKDILGAVGEKWELLSKLYEQIQIEGEGEAEPEVGPFLTPMSGCWFPRWFDQGVWSKCFPQNFCNQYKKLTWRQNVIMLSSLILNQQLLIYCRSVSEYCLLFGEKKAVGWSVCMVIGLLQIWKNNFIHKVHLNNEKLAVLLWFSERWRYILYFKKSIGISHWSFEGEMSILELSRPTAEKGWLNSPNSPPSKLHLEENFFPL